MDPQVIAPTNAEILPPLPEPEAGELKKHLKQVRHVISAVPLYYRQCMFSYCAGLWQPELTHQPVGRSWPQIPLRSSLLNTLLY